MPRVNSEWVANAEATVRKLWSRRIKVDRTRIWYNTRAVILSVSGLPMPVELALPFPRATEMTVEDLGRGEGYVKVLRAALFAGRKEA